MVVELVEDEPVVEQGGRLGEHLARQLEVDLGTLRRDRVGTGKQQVVGRMRRDVGHPGSLPLVTRPRQPRW